jgi:hypothetical protein
MWLLRPKKDVKNNWDNFLLDLLLATKETMYEIRFPKGGSAAKHSAARHPTA